MQPDALRLLLSGDSDRESLVRAVNKAEIYRIMKRLAEEGVGIILISSEMTELRRSASQNLLTPAQQQQLKHSLLTAELELERLEQQLLLAQCPTLTASPQPLLESYLALLTRNTATYAAALLDLRQSLLQSG